jgi:hypothetical protein
MSNRGESPQATRAALRNVRAALVEYERTGVDMNWRTLYQFIDVLINVLDETLAEQGRAGRR